MERERWLYVKKIVNACLGMKPDQRAPYVREECNGESCPLTEVERLLASHGNLAEFLAVGLEEPFDELPSGMRVGSYEIREAIAEGGMGRVYRAVRAVDFEKQVALKVVKRGMDTGFILRRFGHERQILAGLDHPNIARLLDGGATEDGRPYLVMEYVEGRPITEYCEDQKLAIPARLQLFRTVCSAVQYAHQHLVVHRDLKPSNILCTAGGVPKLLDFGIAKLLEPHTDVTMTSQRLLTPECASPEQVRGELITTSTDVYALGVLLYQMLARRSPYLFTTRTPEEIRRIVCEAEPQRPSCFRPLPKDLDNIVLKAMDKQPSRRYASAGEFAEDIRHCLTGQPVMARKATLSYRATKFIGRHSGAVTTALMVSLTLLAGLAMTVREAQIAQRRFNDVRALANSLIFDIHDSIKDLSGATAARKLLVNRGLQYLDSLARDAGNDVYLQQDLAAAYEKVGEVQGNPYGPNLGETAGALASYRKALAIRESIAKKGGNLEENQRGLADDYEWIGMALEASGDYSGALDNYQRDLVIQQFLAATEPNTKSQERLAGAYFLIARCRGDLGDLMGALENYRKSAAIRESIASNSPFLQTRLAGTYSYMGGILSLQGEFDRAIVLQRRAVDISKKAADNDPTNATYREFLNEAYYWVGRHLERNRDFAQASLNYRRALTGFEALGLADPKEARTRRYIGMCLKSIGSLLVAEGQTTQGLESIRKGLALLEGMASADRGESIERLEDVADAYAALGLAYSSQAGRPSVSMASRMARWREARTAYRKSLDVWLEVKRRRALTAFSAGEPERIAGEVARCDAALAELSARIQ